MTDKRIIITGATGYVGRFIVEQQLASGNHVLVLGRTPPADGFFSRPVGFAKISLSQSDFNPEMFAGYDGLVHAAFHHIPGKYRGGEGDDPDGFKQRNHFGSLALFEAAKAAGVPRVLFLSSRAVYGRQEAGARLFESTPPQPDTVYGSTKLLTEQALGAIASADFLPIILRATGVYGPSPSSQHKWHELFKDFLLGKDIAPRVGTEVHGEDLAHGVDLLLNTDASAITSVAEDDVAPIFNISDILLDRRELLQAYRYLICYMGGNLPKAADAANYNAMDCTRLKSLGWQPRGKLDLSWLPRA